MVGSLPKTMRAARVLRTGQEHYVVQDVPVPEPQGYEVLLKIGAAGFCHTDAMVMDGSFDGLPPEGVTGSHEPAGTIVKLGPDTQREGVVSVGQRVAAMLQRNVCRTCPDCKLKSFAYCPNCDYGGIMVDGFFAEYALVDSRLCATLPDSLSFEQAAPLTCAGLTIYSAIQLAIEKGGLKPDTGIIAISGLGALGHLGTQMVKALGYKCVGIDARKEPIDLVNSVEHKPNLTINAAEVSGADAAEQINKLRPEGYFGWPGADVVIVTADAKPAQKYACDIVRRHGLFVAVSQPPQFVFDFRDIIFKDITIMGSLHGGPEQLQAAVDLCAKEGIVCETTPFGIERHAEMVEAPHKEGWKGKAVMVFEQ